MDTREIRDPPDFLSSRAGSLMAALEAEAFSHAELSQMKVRRGIRFLPAFGAASLTLAHLQTAAAFRRKSREIFARLENMAAGEVQAAPVPAIIQAFASRAVGRNPVPRAVWLRQTGEMRVMPNAQWRAFTAEQVISVHRPGFAWLARMQAMPLLSAHT